MLTPQFNTLPPQNFVEPPLLVEPGTSVNAAFAHPEPGQLIAEAQVGDHVQIRHSKTGQVYSMPAELFQGQAEREAEDKDKLRQRAALAAGPAAGKAAILGSKGEVYTSPEGTPKGRLEAVFEPLAVYTEQDSVPEPEEDYYTLMLTATDEELAAHQAVWRAKDEAKARENFWPVTQETKRDAVSHLLKLVQDPDKRLQGVIDQLRDNIDLNNPSSVVDKIRTDKDVRLAFAKYFTDKIEYMISNAPLLLPSRLFANMGKAQKRKVSNVDRLTNREVVALMCLAKIDGTFDQKSVLSTDIADKGDIDSRGQHNHAADTVLEYRDSKDYDYFHQNTSPWGFKE